MIRGTTPIHVFKKLPVLVSDIQEIWVTYLQGGKPILTKTKADVTLQESEDGEDTCTAIVHLTQEDTLSFASGQASVQVRLLLTSNTALASNEVTIMVRRVTRDGKIE